jgi:hypothetical protein
MPLVPAPALSTISIDQGDTLGGETVVLTGSVFTGATDVKFGATSATSFVVDSDSQITSVAPAHSAGSINITVVGPGGTSNGVAYEFWDPTVPIAPTSFMEAGDYAIPGGVGTWTARVGAGASSGASYPDNTPTGTAKFIGANNDRLAGPDTGWDALITRASSNGATIAVVLDVDSTSTNAIISDRDFYGALVFEPTHKATFYYYQGSYKTVQVTVPSSGRMVLVVRRDISGTPVLQMTTDGVTWTTGDNVGTMSNLTSGMWLGYNGDLALYPLDATFQAIVTAKTKWSDAEVVKFYKWAANRHPVAAFDPATLALTFWSRASYQGVTWPGVASAGSSGSHNLALSTSNPTVGGAQNGYASAACNWTNSQGFTNATAISTLLSASAWSVSMLVKITAFHTNSSTTYSNDILIADTGSFWGIFVKSSGNVRAYQWDGAEKYAETTISSGAYALIQAKYDGTNIKVRVNGGAWQSAAAGNISTLTGTLSVMFLGGLAAEGLLEEVMGAAVTWSDADCDNILAYTRARYALTL